MSDSVDAGRADPAGVDRRGAAQATSGAGVLGGGVWTLASRFIPQFYVIAMSIAGARYLGPDQFGRQSFIAFVSISVATLCTAGFHVALTRFISDALGRAREDLVPSLIRLGWRVQACGTSLGIVVLVVVAFTAAGPRAAWLFAAITTGAVVLYKAPASLLTGAQRWRAMTIPPLLIGLPATVATVAALALGWGISGMFGVETVAALCSLAVATVLSRRVLATFPARTRISRVEMRAILRFAALTSIGVVITLVVWRRSEVFVLQRYATEQEVGLYAIAFSAAAVLSFSLQGLTSTLFPATATLHAAGEIERIRSGYGRAVRLVLVTILPLTAIALAIGPPVVTLAYGAGFQGAIAPLRVLLAFLPVLVLASIGTGFLTAVGRLSPAMVAGLIAAVVDLGLDFALIPSYGAIGAAIANSVAQTIVAVAVLVFAWRMLGGVDWDPATIARSAVASVGSGLAAWSIVHTVGGVTGVTVGLVVGLVVLVGFARALRIVPADDARWLDQTVGRLLGGWLGRLIRLVARPSTDAL
jgi:O-antigen/teichoic acid export membrane protein